MNENTQKGTRQVDEIVYVNLWPVPVRAKIVEPALFRWSNHTVKRDDLPHNTLTLERDLVTEEYANHMKQLHEEFLTRSGQTAEEYLRNLYK